MCFNTKDEILQIYFNFFAIFFGLVPVVGFEPLILGLWAECSTTVLLAYNINMLDTKAVIILILLYLVLKL